MSRKFKGLKFLCLTVFIFAISSLSSNAMRYNERDENYCYELKDTVSTKKITEDAMMKEDEGYDDCNSEDRAYLEKMVNSIIEEDKNDLPVVKLRSDWSEQNPLKFLSEEEDKEEGE